MTLVAEVPSGHDVESYNIGWLKGYYLSRAKAFKFEKVMAYNPEEVTKLGLRPDVFETDLRKDSFILGFQDGVGYAFRVHKPVNFWSGVISRLRSKIN